MPCLFRDSALVRAVQGEKAMSISVIIPTRNAPSILALTLAHYWANAHDDRLVDSVTLLDNASTAPGMEAVLADAQRRGAQVIRHEKNIGVWASINRGLVLSRSEKVFVLTSDIFLAPDALKWLHAIQDDTGCAFLGPQVVSDQQEYTWLLYEDPLPAQQVNLSTYNGAVFLLTRTLLDKVGMFDSQFYITYGDTDYAQRTLDAGLSFGLTESVRCIHLNQQSRQADFTVEQDTTVEINDWKRFASKWQHRPDVMIKHQRPDYIKYSMIKERYWKK